jgi:hypothetical protein
MLNDWSFWSLPRVLTLILGIGYLMIWMQITVWHARGKFHKWQMWIPVIALPLFSVVAIVLSIWPLLVLGWIHTVLSILAIVVGAYGGTLHIIAIKHRTGGFKFENVMAGPPFVLPFTVGAFGLIHILLLWY